MKQAGTFKISPEWKQSLSIKDSSSWFHQNCGSELIAIVSSTNYRGQSQGAYLWLSLLPGTINWLARFRHPKCCWLTFLTFSGRWVLLYGIPSIILSDNGETFVSEIFISLCNYLGSKNVTMTAYHWQRSGRLERYNRTLVSRLWLYVNNSQQNGDIVIHPLTYAYKRQPYRSINASTLSVTLTQHLLVWVTIYSPTILLADPLTAMTPIALSVRLLAQLDAMSRKVSGNSRQNQHWYWQRLTQKLGRYLNFQLNSWYTSTVRY